MNYEGMDKYHREACLRDRVEVGHRIEVRHGS